jgi:membrane-bound lytic murein transglycosylase B
MRIFVLVFVLLWPSLVAAQSRGTVETQFRGWLEQVVWPRAQQNGVARGTFDAAFSGVELNWDLPDLVPPGGAPPAQQVQRQSEFGAPGKYFSRGGVDGATSVGRQMARQHAATLAAVEYPS